MLPFLRGMRHARRAAHISAFPCLSRESASRSHGNASSSVVRCASPPRSSGGSTASRTCCWPVPPASGVRARPRRGRRLHPQAGVGLHLRRIAAGRDRRGAALVPRRRGARAQRLPHDRGGRHPDRHARDAPGVGPRAVGHRPVPRHRDGHGAVQDRRRVVDVRGRGRAADRRGAAVQRIHVRGRRLVHGARLSAVRPRVHPVPAPLADRDRRGSRSTRTSSRTTGGGTCAGCCWSPSCCCGRGR